MHALLVGPENPHFLGHLRTLQMLPEVTRISLAANTPADMAALRDVRIQFPDKVRDEYRSLEEALAGKPAFAIACPRNDRAVDVIGGLLRAGVPVLAEKPVGRNANETSQLVHLAVAKNLPLGVCYANRLHPATQAAREFVTAGLLGQLMAVEMRWWTTQPKFRDPKHWLFSKALSGGGIVHWLGCHLLDLARYISGSDIAQLSGVTATRSGEAIDVEDSAALQLKFANGAVGSLACGYVLAQSGGGFYNRAGNDTHIAFIGSAGRVWWSHTQAPCVVHFESNDPSWAFAPRRDVTLELPETPAYGGRHGEEFVRRFIHAVNGKGAPVATGYDALHIAKLLDQLYKGAST